MKKLLLVLAACATPAFAAPDAPLAAQSIGDDPSKPPPPPASYAGESIHDPAEMAHARHMMAREMGGMSFSMVRFDLAEIRMHRGSDSYHWDADAWSGGDIDRLVLRSEGEGQFGGTVEHAELQALWSHAIDPYFNLEAGARFDASPGPNRGYAVLGVTGLAPYWFEVDAHLFLSDKGELFGRVSAEYDQHITQRLIVQPRFEANFAAKRVSELEIGGGLTDFELGLRMRYEIRREFAPYIGVVHERKVGETADFAHAAGESAHDTSIVAGIRLWF